MADSFISVPDIDLETPIKKARTNTRVVGAETVHEHFYIVQDITNNTQARVLATDPAPTDGGLVVRPIQATHDNLNLNANIQVGNADVAGGNPVPISVASLPLPTGASTLAEQQTQTTSLQLIDDTVFTDDTSTHSTGVTKGIGFMAVATPTDASINANDIGMVAMTVDRKLHVSVQDAIPAGANTIGSIASITTSITPGTAAANLGKAEDALHASGDVGVMMLGVRNDNGATTFGGNGDYCPIGVLANGSQYLGSVVPGTSPTELGKAEDLASASGDVGVMALAKRLDTPVANANVSADADYLPLITDNLGKLWNAQTQTEDAGHTSGDRGSFILGVRNTSNTTSTSADRDYSPVSTDLWDAPISGMRRQSTTLTAINTTYDDSPTTATSATVDASMFRMGIFVAEVTESGAATDITFTLQMSPDGTTWYDYRVGPWVKYRFDDATIAAHTSNTLKICEPFMITCSNIRMLVTCTGTDASNSFTVANAKFELQN